MTIDPPVPVSRRRRAALVPVLLAVVLALVAGCSAPAPSGAGTAQAPAPPATAALTPADLGAWLDGLVPAALDRAGIAGAAVTVVRDGRVLAARGYGVAGPGEGGSGRPVDPDSTLFRPGSVSKVVTAVAVLGLVEQGRIALDADVRGYLDFPLPLRFPEPVTMRHLLSHTAGFEERIRGLIGTDPNGPGLREVLATDPPEQVFAPGTVPAYSNYGYGLAGYVVERVAGEPFEDYVQHAVLDRAGMTSSTFAQPLPEPLRGRMAAGYPTVDAPAEPFEIVRPAPAGALTASASDMARFASALLGAPGAPALLSPETTRLMQAPALGADTLGALAEGPRMALGLFDESRNGRRILGHGGDTQYFHSHLQLHPQERIGVFVTTNSTGRGAMDTLELRRAVLEGFTDRYLPPAAAGTDAPADDPGTPARAAAVAGGYEPARAPFSTFLSAMSLVGQTTVTARPDGTLLASPGPADAYPVAFRELRPGLWQEIGGQRLLTVRTDGDRVTAIGYESAFTLLPTSVFRDAGLAVPVLVGSAVVLLVGLLAWPAGAVWRRRYGVSAPASPGRADRVLHLLTRLAAGCAVLALAGWATVVASVAGLSDVPEGVLQVLRAAQWAATAGVLVAAAGVVTAVRGRIGRSRITGRVLPLLGLAGTAWIALAFGLLSPSLSY